MTQAGFTPALREGTATYKEGNQLYQLWTRNIRVTNAVVVYPYPICLTTALFR